MLLARGCGGALRAVERALALLDNTTIKDDRPLWRDIARPEQIPPPGTAWRTWLFLAGRGAGKSRSAAEAVCEYARTHPGHRIALVGRTAADVRDTMLCGESGILSVARLDFMPTWEPSKRKVTWPNGAQALSISSEEPSQLRGVQFHYAWADELAAWRTERGIPPAWDQLQFTMRLGQTPQVIVTTTPRPTKIIRMLLESTFTAVTRGRTQDNAANLAPAFIQQIEARYAGSRLGRQELDGVVLDDAPGALWKRDQIDADRVQSHPPLARVVVAIDPAATSNEDSCETGIVVAGVSHTGEGYLLDDLTGTYTPDGWARVAIGAYERYGADRIVAEVNHGGDMIESVVRSVAKDLGVNPAFRAVRASRGKATRAEPISALCEQHRIHHVGEFLELDDCLCTWDPALSADSPDRLDAYVWAFTDLKIGPKPANRPVEPIAPPSRSW